ncbi:N-acyl-D-glutamate deacylase [Synergistales bacterium]|nr:N-acyl-D-glutamate deacylase [Synergistales bacterium]
MRGPDLIIRGGTLFGMTEDRSPGLYSIAVKDGRVSAILPPDAPANADRVFDASGMFVAPGFVDIHIHDEYFQDTDTVQHCLIRQGITTAVAGNCGSGPSFDKSFAARPRPWLHLSFLVGNCAGLREEVGHSDRYTPATADETSRMCELLRDALSKGAIGLSLGLEYAPGASYEEIMFLAAVVAEFRDRIITVHIRYDDHRCVDAVREAAHLSRMSGARLQVSHLGSMTMGYTRECEKEIERAVSEGADIGFDCYPYDAFCAKAGSAVYDDGFAERWNGKGPECLEAVSGRFKGNRLTFETLAEMRKEEPLGLIVAHVMEKAEVEDCIANRSCVIASDALFSGGGAHPRIAGTFPRALRILREYGYGWEDALRKMTAMPADRMRLPAGRLFEGSPADVIVFDPDNFTDRATFKEPFLPPDGLKLVVINGEPVLENGKMSEEPHGDFYRRGN